MNKYGFEIVASAPIKATRPPMPELAGGPIPGLTDTQDRRYRLWIQGLTHRQIARIEGVSESRSRIVVNRAREIIDGS